MTRVLITGMSGTGKSAVMGELAARGFRTVETDGPDWSEMAVVPMPAGVPGGGAPDWAWREDRMRALLSGPDDELLFVSGCAPNQGAFYPQFGHVILLTAPVDIVLQRLATRTNNPWGKRADERTKILEDIRIVEPLLRQGATLEIDTTLPIDRVVETILDHVR